MSAPRRPDAAFRAELGQRLRAARNAAGMSLRDVELATEGRWREQVTGSYERGQRAVTVESLAELAGFYSVPVASLIPGEPHLAAEAFTAITAAKDAQMLAMAQGYEQEIAGLRARMRAGAV